MVYKASGVSLLQSKKLSVPLYNDGAYFCFGLSNRYVYLLMYENQFYSFYLEAHELRHLIRSNDDLKGHVECITAPYEASAQIAYLCRTNYTELAIGDDSNLIIYGAPRILFKMDNKGDGMLLNVEALVTEKIYDNGQRLVDWSPALLLGIAALAGCGKLKQGFFSQ